MELHSPAAAKRLWSYLRVAFFMIRKGIVSKRRLLLDMNLMMKRGKLMGKSLGNVVFHHHQHASLRGHGFGLQEYEFSCANSPNPLFLHARRSRHRYFPCLGGVTEEEDKAPAVPAVASPLRILYSPAVASQELSISPTSSSTLSVEDMEAVVEEMSDFGLPLKSNEVDHEAEEFIRRFYQHLRRQSRIALLQYEIDYKEMLARGR